MRRSSDGEPGDEPEGRCARESAGALPVRLLEKFHVDQRGVTATEYIVILVLVAAFIIAVVSVFGEQLTAAYREVVDTLYRDVRQKT